MARKNLTGVGKLLDQIAQNALENFRTEQQAIRNKAVEEVKKAMGINDLVKQLEKLTGDTRINPSLNDGSPASKELNKRLEEAGFVSTSYYQEPSGLAELKLNWQIRMLSIETGEDVGKYVNSFRKEISDLLHAWKP